MLRAKPLVLKQVPPRHTCRTDEPVCCCLYISKKPFFSQANTLMLLPLPVQMTVLQEPLIVSVEMLPPEHEAVAPRRDIAHEFAGCALTLPTATYVVPSACVFEERATHCTR